MPATPEYRELRDMRPGQREDVDLSGVRLVRMLFDTDDACFTVEEENLAITCPAGGTLLLHNRQAIRHDAQLELQDGTCVGWSSLMQSLLLSDADIEPSGSGW